ncbi:MAG TPA: hypothetical protein VG733_09905, partial [Chthoniobacteraceae bacterium]|nr:hypothetical protein [Chthoniobacteraceae bacterium]
MNRSRAKFRRSRIGGLCWFLGVVLFLDSYWWVMANHVIRNFWDPPYGMKIDRLRVDVAKYPGHPLWIVMGSSRLMQG